MGMGVEGRFVWIAIAASQIPGELPEATDSLQLPDNGYLAV